MQVVIHAGVHFTDNDLLLRTLRRNVGMLRDSGTKVPGPGKYRRPISEILTTLNGAPANADSRDVMIDQILDGDNAGTKRLVLSHPNLFCVPKLLLAGGRYYRHAERRIGNMCELFAGDDIELFLALRDPATFLPTIFENTPYDTFDELLRGVDPAYLRWSDLLHRFREELPQVKLTVWCNEDTPLIWSEVLCRVAGISLDSALDGEYDVLASIMEPAGMEKFQEFLREHPAISLAHKRRVMLSFLDQFALQDEIEQELDIPGWDDAYVQRLNDIYDEDMDTIASMSDVKFIEP